MQKQFVILFILAAILYSSLFAVTNKASSSSIPSAQSVKNPYAIPAPSSGIVVSPPQLNFTVPQFFWSNQTITITNTGNSLLTYQITDEITSSPTILSRSSVLNKDWRWFKKILLSRLRMLDFNTREIDDNIVNTNRRIPAAGRSVVISDTTGDTNLPGVDIISAEFSEDFFNYKIQLNFAGTPDTNSLGIIVFDVDQNFGTGSYPPPLGFGPGNFDLGAEYEMYFDFANQIGDTLGLPPSVYLLAVTDSTPTPAGLPMPIQINGSSASVNLLKLLYPFFDANMNLGAMMIDFSGQALPDVAPDFGHGRRGNELGCSWLTELDDSLQAAYPLTGSVSPGDSVQIFAGVAGSYPTGTYSAKLVVQNNSPTPLIEVPVQMQVVGGGHPHISINPVAITDTLAPGSGISNYFLVISNNGTAPLFFTLVDSIIVGGGWLSIPQSYGAVQPGHTTSVALQVNTQGFLPGTLYQAQIRAISNDPTSPQTIVPVNIFSQSPNSLEYNFSLPKQPLLYPNYPNPFNPETTIRFSLPRQTMVKLDIFNALGQRVAILINRQMPAGLHQLKWNGRVKNGMPAPSGIYFYRLTVGQMVLVQKMLLSR